MFVDLSFALVKRDRWRTKTADSARKHGISRTWILHA
jgi:hypothetical protein